MMALGFVGRVEVFFSVLMHMPSLSLALEKFGALSVPGALNVLRPSSECYLMGGKDPNVCNLLNSEL